MARYTCLFTVEASLNGLHQVLSEVLESCYFDIIYQTPDYLMGREIPGRVSYSKLVTVEVLIDRTVATDHEVRMNFVIKNEELPLQVDNHCHQMFDLVGKAMADSQGLKLIEAVAG
jgi:hypothetical protein